MGSLMASLYTGNTGLHTAGIGVGVVGDNIANTNTTGFKVSRAHFQDLLSQFIVGVSGTSQMGKGASLQRIEKMFTQGSFAHTGVPTDMAVGGDGFFIVRGTQGGVTQNTYTRAGSFRFDDEGFLINQSGFRVQGLSANALGELNATLGDIQVNQTNLEPHATEDIQIYANLRPDDPILAFDPDDPENTSSYHTTMTLYDSLGNGHSVDVYGSRIADGQWEMNAMVDGGALAGGVPGEPAQIALGTLEFDAEGALLTENIGNPINVPWAGADPGSVTFDFGDALNDGGTGRGGTTQWNRVSESSTSFLTQDGYGTGSLDGITVDEQGLIIGGYTNGRTQVLGQVQLARFNDPTGLVSVGGNRFVETPNSGPANIGGAQSGGRGAIYSGALELSNVEISDQFIDLIAYQRAYQANARTISTADGLLQEVFQILR